MSFDESGNVVKDVAFDSAVAGLRSSGSKIKTMEWVTTEKPASGATDPKAEALLNALKEVGVAENDATVKLRVATNAEKSRLALLGGDANAGLVFKR